jgi:ammonia channel protein AmtB
MLSNGDDKKKKKKRKKNEEKEEKETISRRPPSPVPLRLKERCDVSITNAMMMTMISAVIFFFRWFLFNINNKKNKSACRDI